MGYAYRKLNIAFSNTTYLKIIWRFSQLLDNSMTIFSILYEKRSKSAIFTVFLDKNGCHFGKKANIKEMVDKVVDTYLGIILTKLQIFTMTTHRSFTIFVKCQKITKNCENANFCENFIFFHPICLDMYVF